jgi:hypothetical protein
MFNVSIREYFSILNVFIVCIRNTARSKSIPLLCTHVNSYKFSTVHPQGENTGLLGATRFVHWTVESYGLQESRSSISSKPQPLSRRPSHVVALNGLRVRVG